jgi:hypothetical protein
VRTNLVTRPSRLMRGTFDYIKKQGATIVRIYAMYEPLKFFFLFGSAIFLIGLAVLARVLVLKLLGGTLAAYIPAIVAGGVLMTIGVLIGLIGLVADLIASVRRLLEDTLYRVKKMELQMERERGEREQLLASILNFDQDGQDRHEAHGGHDLARDLPIAADHARDSITSLASVRSRRDSPPDRPTR